MHAEPLPHSIARPVIGKVFFNMAACQYSDNHEPITASKHWNFNSPTGQ
jgi:hypothetical protein